MNNVLSILSWSWSSRVSQILSKLDCQECLHGLRVKRNFWRLNSLWATVCKTVRPTLWDRCPVMSVCLSVLSVTLVYCGQTVGWIKMKLPHGRARPRPHCVRWGPCSSTERGTAAPVFRPMPIVANRSPVSATAELLLLLVLFRYLFQLWSVWEIKLLRARFVSYRIVSSSVGREE